MQIIQPSAKQSPHRFVHAQDGPVGNAQGHGQVAGADPAPVCVMSKLLQSPEKSLFSNAMHADADMALPCDDIITGRSGRTRPHLQTIKHRCGACEMIAKCRDQTPRFGWAEPRARGVVLETDAPHAIGAEARCRVMAGEEGKAALQCAKPQPVPHDQSTRQKHHHAQGNPDNRSGLRHRTIWRHDYRNATGGPDHEQRQALAAHAFRGKTQRQRPAAGTDPAFDIRIARHAFPIFGTHPQRLRRNRLTGA